MRIALVIFDMDGVITETTHEHYQAWTLLFKKHFNINLNPDFETYTRGVSRLESLEILLSKSGIHIASLDVKKALANEKNLMYQQLIQAFDSSKVLPGVKDLIRYLKERNIKIALGSASKNGSFLLERLGLKDAFDYHVDPSHLRSKPKPDIFLDAMHHFRLSPKACLGIEDAEAGIQAIKAAGMYAIGVGKEPLIQADWKLNDLASLDYQKLEEILMNPYEK